MKKSLLAVVALMVGLTACTNNSKSTVTEDLAMDSIGTERRDTVADVRIHVVYPTQGPAALVDSLRRFVAQTLQDGAIFEPADEVAAGNPFVGNPALVNDAQALLDAAARRDYDRLKTDREEMLDGFEDDAVAATWPAYESMCDITLLHETATYVTLVVQRYEFLGGAHGSTYVSGTTFSKSDGRQLGWSMLKDTDSPAFRQLMREGIRQYFQGATDDTVSDEQLGEWLMLPSGTEQIPLPAVEPYLTADGVAFVYQQYEIAPYAAGLPSFTVSYADIRPFLSPVALSLLAEDQIGETAAK